MKRTFRPNETMLQQEERKAQRAKEVGISEQVANKLETLIFRKIVMNGYGMGPFDYYLGIRESSAENVVEWDKEVYETIKNLKCRLFIELTLVDRYRNSVGTAAEARAEGLMERAVATKAEIESEQNKVIPIRRAAQRDIQKTTKLAQ